MSKVYKAKDIIEAEKLVDKVYKKEAEMQALLKELINGKYRHSIYEPEDEEYMRCLYRALSVARSKYHRDTKN